MHKLLKIIKQKFFPFISFIFNWFLAFFFISSIEVFSFYFFLFLTGFWLFFFHVYALKFVGDIGNFRAYRRHRTLRVFASTAL